MFADDMVANDAALREAIAGSRIIVVGAAGSIGGAFVHELIKFSPRTLHLVDINENGLVEVVRGLRSSIHSLPEDLATFSVDFGSAEFAHLFDDNQPYDIFLNFSALKHVRAERDPYSLMRMIDVNVRALFSHVRRARHRRIFSVSTDKSVSPVNLMGATKNLMERALFAADAAVTSTARFANVAFSAGSLPEGFLYRIGKRQPLAAPTDVRRYFISHEEAAQLCLLAAFRANNREAFFPKLDACRDTKTFSEIAVAILGHLGHKIRLCSSDDEAKQLAARREFSGGWPCYFHSSDTTGEKPLEEFYRVTDTIDQGRFHALATVEEPVPDLGILETFLGDIDRLRRGNAWTKADIVDRICAAVPELHHVERHRSLDQKM